LLVWGSVAHALLDELIGAVPGDVSPSNSTVPSRTGTSPSTALRNVDLPAPLGPMMPTNSRCSVRSSPLRMFTSGT